MDSNASAPAASSRLPKILLRIAIAIGVVLAIIAVVGFLIAPRIVKAKGEEILTRELRRPTTIEKVSINPFVPSATIRNVVVKEPDGTATFFSFEELYVEGSFSSLWRFAPVIDRVRLIRPYTHLVRFSDRRYNVQDLVDEALARPRKEPEPDQKPPRFSVFNIEVLDGRIELDDQALEQKHEVREIEIGVPFVSSLPYAREIDVKPELAAVVDGAAFSARGETTPFADRNESTLTIDIDQLELPRFLEYSPVPLKFEMASGSLETRLKVLFVTELNRPRDFQVSGLAAINRAKFVDLRKAPLLGWQRASVDIEKVDFFNVVANVRSARLEQPEITAVRERDGSLNLLAFVTPPPPQKARPRTEPAQPSEPGAAPPSAKPFTYRIDEVVVTGGKAHVEDRALEPRSFATDLQNIELAVKGISSEDGRKADVTASFDTDGLGRFTNTGTLQARPSFAMEGKGQATGFRVGRIYPYLAPVLNLDIADGTVDVGAGYVVTESANRIDIRISGLDATLKSLVLKYPGEAQPVATIPVAEIRGGDIDVGKRHVVIAESVIRNPTVNARRDPDGTINFARLIKQVDAKAAETGAPPVSAPSATPPVPVQAAAPPATAQAAAPGTNEAAAPGPGPVTEATAAGGAKPAAALPPWRIDSKRSAIENLTATFEDRVPKPPVTTKLTAVDVVIENGSNWPGTTATLNAKATVNGKGTLVASGPVSSNPFAAELKVETKALGFASLQPYLDGKLNIALTSGALSTKGTAKVDAAPGKPLAVSYRGDVNVTNFASVDKVNREDFLNWKSLYLGGIDFALEPLRVRVNEIALSDFFARIILSAQGRLNLQDIVRQPGQAAQSVTDVEMRKRPATRAPPGAGRNAAPATPTAAGASPLDGSGGEQAASQDAAGPATATAAPPSQGTPARAAKGAKGGTGESIDTTRRELAAKIPENIRIGKITLQGGDVRFSDFFVRPNYTANLTGIGGSVTEMTVQKAGDVDLRGKVDNAAPVEIVGRVNALSADLFIDLAASATDIELPPLSPYAIKYAGYGIERGKLTMKVKYLIENRKLAAENHLYLDQLTFGPKVESPTATKLPVLLAVALLKDRNGVIDIDLPISGTIDDPQFSIWGIIGKVILNLITKAVTAPFSVLASLAGSKEELSYIEFQPGRDKLTGPDESKLKSLAKALDDRPQLKLDVSGRADPEADREALRELSIERKVQQQKWQALRREGRAPATAEEVTVDKGEYEKYLRLAYRAEDFPKPRNAIGLVKDLPVEEMENLMRTNAQVSDEDLRVLANQRAQAAKTWIVEQGRIPADRVFLVAPKLSNEGLKDKSKATLVEFSIKQ
jgi:hypothetical protein